MFKNLNKNVGISWAVAILAAIGQSTELPTKVDLLRDDSVFAELESKRGVNAIFHGPAISFNLSGVDSV